MRTGSDPDNDARIYLGFVLCTRCLLVPVRNMQFTSDESQYYWLHAESRMTHSGGGFQNQMFGKHGEASDEGISLLISRKVVKCDAYEWRCPVVRRRLWLTVKYGQSLFDA